MDSLSSNRIILPEIHPFTVTMWPGTGGFLLNGPWNGFSVVESAYGKGIRFETKDANKLAIAFEQANRYLKRY